MSSSNIGPKYLQCTLGYVAAIAVFACSVPEYNMTNLGDEGGQFAAASGGGTNATGGSSGITAGGASAVGGVTNSGAKAGNLTSGGNNSGGQQSSGGLSDNAGAGVIGGTTSASSTGGTTATGGAIGMGGALVTGGAVATGGMTSPVTSGGTPSTGGSNAAGAVQSTGGIVSTGGAPLTGGTLSAGGTPNSGGAQSTGGIMNSGGLVSTGGAMSTGGAVSTGGTPSTGGLASTGGLPGTGGTPATGGTSAAASGGSSSTCAAGYAFCDNFEQDTLNGAAKKWTAGTGTWAVLTDSTETAGDQQIYSNKLTSNSTSQAGTSSYTNATIEARLKVTGFSSTSASNAAGIFLRNNGTNDYDLSLGADGMVYLRRAQTSSTVETCTGGTSSAVSRVIVTTNGCSSASPCTPGWFKLKLAVSGTVAGGITVTGYVDPTGSSGYTQVLQCVQNPGTQYMIDSGTAGVFAKGSAPAEYDDVLLSTP